MSDAEITEIHDWTDEATGYECHAIACPWWCGYVRVPDDHPWHDKGYSSNLCGHDGCYEHAPEGLIQVHGGVTFSGVPSGGPTEGNWYGFDCAHAGDHVDYGVPGVSVREGHRWTLDEVKTECAGLAKQIHDHA